MYLSRGDGEPKVEEKNPVSSQDEGGEGGGVIHKH